MQEKYFMTFVGDQFELDKKIKKWMEENNCKEVDRSAPAITINVKGWVIVAVTVTIEKLN